MDGQRFRLLAIVDDYTRECLAILVDQSISGLRMIQIFERLRPAHGRPVAIVMDNDTEFTSSAMFRGSQGTGVDLRFIEPGKPLQYAVIESFNGRLRDKCLNEHVLSSSPEARAIIEAWCRQYNAERPHGSLTPQEFKVQINAAA